MAWGCLVPDSCRLVDRFAESFRNTGSRVLAQAQTEGLSGAAFQCSGTCAGIVVVVVLGEVREADFHLNDKFTKGGRKTKAGGTFQWRVFLRPGLVRMVCGPHHGKLSHNPVRLISKPPSPLLPEGKLWKTFPVWMILEVVEINFWGRSQLQFAFTFIVYLYLDPPSISNLSLEVCFFGG